MVAINHHYQGVYTHYNNENLFYKEIVNNKERGIIISYNTFEAIPAPKRNKKMKTLGLVTYNKRGKFSIFPTSLCLLVLEPKRKDINSPYYWYVSETITLSNFTLQGYK